MTDVGTFAVRDGVGIIKIASPPVNALSPAVRQALAHGFARFTADDAVKAIVVICSGRTFFAGADVAEFGKPSTDPTLPALIAAAEATPKPIIAAIHGTALGGGYELALACHYRIAVPSAKIGLPEVKLGLLPGAGGTQRLTRILGVAKALEVIVGGEAVSAPTALELGMIDALARSDALEEDAVAMARDVAAQEKPLRRVRDRTDMVERDKGNRAVFDEFRRKNTRLLRGFKAPEKIIASIESAVELPFEEGIKQERAFFSELLVSPESLAQRYYFFAERAAAKIDGLPADTPTVAINSIGVIGAGTMGGGIAMNLLSAGIPVTIVERDSATLDKGVAIIRKNYEASARKGRITTAHVEGAMALLTPTTALDEIAQCSLVIEAVFEDMNVKKDLFRRLDRISKPGAILASNTSYLDIDEIAAVTERPEFVVGLHFFSPANVMKLLEIVRGARTSASVIKTSMELAKKIGKIAVLAGVCHGFIGNRMLAQRQRQAQRLILEGAKPWDIDAVLTNFGFPMGPFHMADLAGLDLGWSNEASKGETVREILCERNRRGQKTRKGYYDYDENRRPSPSLEVEQVIADVATKSGIAQREVSEQEVLEALLYPMINEGARILEEGIAQRASDIDVVYVNGYGWPVWTGGPMFWADRVGLAEITAKLDDLSRISDTIRPARLLLEKAGTGERFTH